LPALLCTLLLSWVLLGALRASGTIAVNRYLAQGLDHLAVLELWHGFFDAGLLRRAVLLSAAGLAIAMVLRGLAARWRVRPVRSEVVTSVVVLASFWAGATGAEIRARAPVWDVTTARLDPSAAHAGMLVIACAAFATSLVVWRALRRVRPERAALLTGGVVLAVAGLLAATRAAPSAAAASSARPNVVVITIDALRADHLSAYGYPRPTSPRIDRFAASAVLYERAISPASSTHPAMAALATSRYPTAFTGRPFKYVPYSFTTLAEALRDAGYRTGAVVSNVWLKASLGFDQGFEEYDQQSAMCEFYADTRRVDWRSAADVSNAALAFLARHRSERFFLWLHYLDPHHPYEPPPPFDRAFAEPGTERAALIARLRALPTDEQTRLLVELGTRAVPVPDETFHAVVDQYDGEIAFTDAQVGRVLDAIERLDVAHATLVVVTADHGEEFRDHGRWGHGETLYQEVIHVPLIVRYPDDPGGRRVAALVRTIDVAPTVLSVVGVAVPPTMHGSDLRQAAARADDDAVSVCPRSRQLSIEAHGWKLITGGTRGGPSLFHVAEDPREGTNLAARDAGRVRALLARLGTRVGPDAGTKLVQRITGVDPAMRRQLQALGYVD
jgi:arylsulfatase A-like enzyme